MMMMMMLMMIRRGQILPSECKVLAVFEDWKGDGAGNGQWWL
jgi:hypothetical protein